MVARHNRRTLNDTRRAAARGTSHRSKERHDLLPWADPYIASLMRAHELQKARNNGGDDA